MNKVYISNQNNLSKKYTPLEYGIKFMTKSPNMSSIRLIRVKPTIGGLQRLKPTPMWASENEVQNVGYIWASFLTASLKRSPLKIHGVGRSWAGAIKFSRSPPISISIEMECGLQKHLPKFLEDVWL